MAYPSYRPWIVFAKFNRFLSIFWNVSFRQSSVIESQISDNFRLSCIRWYIASNLTSDTFPLLHNLSKNRFLTNRRYGSLPFVSCIWIWQNNSQLKCRWRNHKLQAEMKLMKVSRHHQLSFVSCIEKNEQFKSLWRNHKCPNFKVSKERLQSWWKIAICHKYLNFTQK